MNSFAQNDQKVGGCALAMLSRTSFVSLCGSPRKPLWYSAFKKQALLLHKMAKKRGGVAFQSALSAEKYIGTPSARKCRWLVEARDVINTKPPKSGGGVPSTKLWRGTFNSAPFDRLRVLLQ